MDVKNVPDQKEQLVYKSLMKILRVMGLRDKVIKKCGFFGFEFKTCRG